MKKNRGILVLVMTVLVTAFLIFTTAVGFGPTGTGAAKNIKGRKNPGRPQCAFVICKI